ncbi:substrate-binding periplasmic protein [Brumimicrobium aurantiacum]|uniref:ABC transporter substrate-binding protein n=1 Tax=Brumimicrobium aurantiacum TaxID=1737063 RepID=A0A3E1EUJ6_9FLAO|nr:transporter substrate-binding domain-containing protein [Brumimicrobium aurantiacum]RFC53153.1 ABC transporter substrate-binding protein [Brumimicrobium aurantiacum]
MRINFSILVLFFVLFCQEFAYAQDSLKVGYVNSAPFIFKENNRLQGPISWLWYNIAEENNYHCEYVQMNSKELVNSLKNGEVDLALYPMSITSSRAKEIDFSVPFYLAHSGIVTNKSSSWKSTLLFIKSFFSLNFFRALGSLFLILMVFGFLTWRFERKGNAEEFGDGLKGLWSGFWWAAVTMTTVGYGDKSPKTTGGRAIALVWMFTAIIIISGLTASIASSLTVTELESRTNNINNFKKKKLATVNLSSTDDWLKDNFYNNVILLDKQDDLLSKLRGDEVDAVVFDLPLLKNMVKNDTLNEYEVLPYKFNPQYYALGMNPVLDDNLLKDINTSLLELTEGLEWKVVLAEYNLNTN